MQPKLNLLGRSQIQEYKITNDSKTESQHGEQITYEFSFRDATKV